MNILAIDTSLRDIAAAVSTGSGGYSERTIHHKRDALQRLAVLIREVLDESGLRSNQIDVVACSHGPGSFTGIRVGVSAAKAFADACGAKMVGASTLALTAPCAAQGDQTIAVIVPCIPGEVYSGCYRMINGMPDLIIPESVIKDSEIPAFLQTARLNMTTPLIVAGPDVSVFENYLSPDIHTAKEAHPQIRHLVEIARSEIESGNLIDPLSFQASYLRASQAEIRAEKA